MTTRGTARRRHRSRVGRRTAAIRKFIARYPGATLHETHPAGAAIGCRRTPRGDLLPDASRHAVAIKALDAFPSPPHTPRAIDGDLKTRWSGGVQRVGRRLHD